MTLGKDTQKIKGILYVVTYLHTPVELSTGAWHTVSAKHLSIVCFTSPCTQKDILQQPGPPVKSADATIMTVVERGKAISRGKKTFSSAPLTTRDRAAAHGDSLLSSDAISSQLARPCTWKTAVVARENFTPRTATSLRRENEILYDTTNM